MKYFLVPFTLHLNFKTITMLMVKVLPFVILAVLVVSAEPSKDDSGECYLMLKHFVFSNIKNVKENLTDSSFAQLKHFVCI